MSQAMAVDTTGATVRAVKGAFAAVIDLTQPSPVGSTTADQLEAQGFRRSGSTEGAEARGNHRPQ
jgi:H+-transporting ATPase